MAALTPKGIQYPTSGDNITPLETHFANLAESADTAIGDAIASSGMPVGGLAGQILAKDTDTDYDTTWIDNYTSQVKHTVKAGEALTKGMPVYVSSANGTNMIVSISSNATEARSSKTMGLIAQDLLLNGQGFVIGEGLLTGLNTDAASAAGASVWLGVDGALIYGTPPTAPAHSVYLGVVTRKHATQGEIFVKVQNGYELGELHNVSITDVADEQVLAYDSATSLWKNKTATGGATTIADVTGLQTALDAKVSDTGDETIAGTKTFSSTITGSVSGNAGTVTNGVYTTGDQTIAGSKTFSSQVTVPTNSGINLTGLGSNYIRGNNFDGYSWTDSNLEISSWYGIGFNNPVAGQTVPQNENAVIINVRSGELAARGHLHSSNTIYAAGAITAGGNVYASGRNYSPHTPYAVAAGVNNLGGGAAARGQSATITFPAGRFTTTPVITVSQGPASGGVSLNAAYHTASASSFVGVLYHIDASTWSGPYPLSWHAIQM